MSAVVLTILHASGSERQRCEPWVGLNEAERDLPDIEGGCTMGDKRSSWVSRDLPGSYSLTETCLMTMTLVADARLSRITGLQWRC